MNASIRSGACRSHRAEQEQEYHGTDEGHENGPRQAAERHRDSQAAEEPAPENGG